MTSPAPRSLLDIAHAIEAIVEEESGIAGLDRDGRAMTVGRGATVRGVRVERTPAGEVVAHLEVVGLTGTALPEIGDRLKSDVEAELEGLDLRAIVFVMFTDLVDPTPEEEPT